MRAVACVLAICVAGCGLTMTKGPDPSRPPDQPPDCTTSMAAPTRDAAPAGIGFLAILTGLLFVKADDNDTVGVPLMVGGGVLMVAAYASGGIGYFRVKRCREAMQDYQRRYPAGPPMQQPAPMP